MRIERLKPELEPVHVELRGGMAMLAAHKDREILIEGAAGTGKTYGISWRIISLCNSNDAIRVLIARKHRSSLTQSVLVTFERVLAKAAPVVLRGASRASRTSYIWPNGSEVALGGFGDAEQRERVKSTEYDIIWINEATECVLDDWELALTRLRHHQLDFQQAIADCNPGPPNHWLNVRANGGQMVRLKTDHEDNPALWNRRDKSWTADGVGYINTLDRLTGARKARLRFGKWASAEGAVFEEVWSEDRHVVEVGPPEARWYFCSVDWGYRDPGVIQVWAVDYDHKLYRVREIYRTQKTFDWWTRQAELIERDYQPQWWIADSANPAYIAEWELRGIPIQPADKERGSIEAGLRLMEERLAKNRMFYVKNATGWYTAEGIWMPNRDESLVTANHPVCTEEEFPLYAYKKAEDGKTIKEEPVDMYNHGIDASRYAVRFSTQHDGDASLEAMVDPDVSVMYDDNSLSLEPDYYGPEIEGGPNRWE